MGNHKVTLASATRMAQFFWPEFTVVDDLVFFATEAPERGFDQESCNRTEIESLGNHVHVLDLFNHEAKLPHEPWWDVQHPDFETGCQIGRIWVETIAAKLASEFPAREFWVYFSKYDNPIVRFHQAHAGEIPYLTIEGNQDAIERGDLVIRWVGRSS